jgi:hypothetical protein
LSSITANPVICRLSLQILSFVIYHCKSCNLSSLCKSCHLSSITANPIICRLSLQILSFVVYHCKSCHLSSITANPVICRLSLLILSFVVQSCQLSITAISCLFCLPALTFPSCFSCYIPLFTCCSPSRRFFCPVLSFPVFLSFLSTSPVSPTRNLIPD